MNKETARYIEMYSAFVKRFFQRLKNVTVWKLKNQSSKLKTEFLDWMVETNFNKNTDYIPINTTPPNITKEMPKIIAFYLPQYYETELNNKYFGKGFMEWYNTTKTIPLFTGHYQPQLPIDVGFYDLSHDDVMQRQIELAKMYGIYGFCFYYYWYRDEVLLEKPILNFLDNKTLNMPFCLMWVNGDWTKTWGTDGKHEREIIKKIELLDGDDEKFFYDTLKYFKDERYIKINNKPVLAIIKSRGFSEERTRHFIQTIDELAKKEGFAGIHFMTTNVGYGEIDTKGLGFDSVIEFEQTTSPIAQELLDLKGRYVNPHFKGRVVDIKRGLDKKLHLKKHSYKTYKCVAPGWDNSARKAYSGSVVYQMTPNDFERWLADVVRWTKENHSEKEQFVFINAWNEWAEGAHLEPDQKYGYAYLQALKNVLTGMSK